MTRLVWDEVSKRKYETGVSRGILFPMAADGTYEKGVPWNGLISVSESPSGAEANPVYADNKKYLNLMSVEEFAATVEAYTYPDEFAACDGSALIGEGLYANQQKRKSFGLCYETILGNDVDGNEYARKIHFIYGALAAPTEKAYGTVNESPEAITFSWELSTTPVEVPGFKPTASLVLNTEGLTDAKITALEDVIYGKDLVESKLPSPAELIALFPSVVG